VENPRLDTTEISLWRPMRSQYPITMFDFFVYRCFVAAASILADLKLGAQWRSKVHNIVYFFSFGHYVVLAVEFRRFFEIIVVYIQRGCLIFNAVAYWYHFTTVSVKKGN
jgi:hypothetical protein